ncbi:serine/threonine protein kinase, partial [Streptomyces oryzae]|nr:serine/threonine protein kinase [Streptomyces oryzae]
PRPSTPPASSPGRHSGRKSDGGAKHGGGRGAGQAGAAAGSATGPAGAGTGGADATGGRTGAGQGAGGSNGAEAGSGSGSGAGGLGGAPLPGTGSGGRALPPESGGSDAITSLRDLRELPELRKGISRRTLAIAAAAVAVVVLVIVLIVANSGGGDDNASKGGSAGTSEDDGKGGTREAEQAAAGTAGQSDDKSGGEQGGKADEDKSDDKAEDKGDSALPGGYARVKDGRFHFSVALPEAWKRAGIAGQNSGRKYAPPGGGYPRIQIDHTSSPGADAVGAWRKLEPAVKSSSPGYKSLGIKKVDWRGYPTVADWQFLRKENGKKVHVLNRGFKVDGKSGYAILITCKADAWQDKACTTLRKTAFKTFEPHA